MIELVFVLLFPLSVSPEFTGNITKCCPLNYDLSVDVNNDNLSCIPSSNRLLATSIESLQIHLPNCTHMFVNVYSKDPVSCVDHIPEFGDIHGVQCKESNNMDQLPQVASIRKCCPSSRKYDSQGQYCWNTYYKDADSVPDLIKLMVRDRELLVNITIGAPTCRSTEVLVDRVVEYKKITLQSNDAVTFDNITFSYDEVCVDLVDDIFEYVVVRTCRDFIETCKHETCVRKCCPEDQEVVPKSCKPSKKQLTYPIYELHDDHIPIVPSSGIKLARLHGDVCQHGKNMLGEKKHDMHMLTTDGKIFMPTKNSFLDTSMYCMDNFQGVTHLFACFEKQPKYEHEIKPLLLAVGATISIIFLLLTLLVYGWLPSLRNLHGKTVMCHTATFVFCYMGIAVQNVLPTSLVLNDKRFCNVLGFTSLFVVLSTFCWLNIISYDIWSTFGAIRSTFLKSPGTKRKLTLYMAYGWGAPLAWTLIAIGCKLSPFIRQDSMFKADFGEDSCWFKDYGRSQLALYLAPVALTLSFNIMIFVITIRYCYKIRSELYNVKNNDNATKKYCANKKELMMGIKLFLVMGLNWTLELMTLTVQPKNRGYFILVDVINVLQGISIFFIFCVKRKVYRDLKNKICGRRMKRQNFVSCASNVTRLSASTTTLSNSANNSRRGTRNQNMD